MREAPETARARVAKWQRENREAYYAKNRVWRKRHPERQRAQDTLRTAIRNGSLVRPNRCPCGSERPQAHHADYDKPLEVTWLCRSCHLVEHGGSFLKSEDAHKGERPRDSKGRFVATAVVVLALAFCVSAGAATQDHYGGVSAQTRWRMITLIHSRFGNGWLGNTMVCIANRESGFNARAVNPRGDVYGLMQIWSGWRHRGESVTHFAARMYNPRENINLAYAIYKRSGLRPWGGGCSW